MVQPFSASNRLLLNLVGAGALSGIAVLIKQSAFDAGLAAVVYLLWRERRRGLAPAAVLVAGALVPVAIAAASSARLSAWLYAVFGYRFNGDSLHGNVEARYLFGAPMARAVVSHWGSSRNADQPSTSPAWMLWTIVERSPSATRSARRPRVITNSSRGTPPCS